MCCVVGYVGSQQSRPIVLEGLARLEYRGYDSAGFACFDDQSKKIVSIKTVGGVDRLVQVCAQTSLGGFSGLGHTRWSTHGVVSVENAHPLLDCVGSVAVVHNGVIENHEMLRAQLRQVGHTFQTTTDTEVIAHLLEQELSGGIGAAHVPGQAVSGSLVSAAVHKGLQQAFRALDGAYACAVLLQAYPEMLLAARQRSPLCIGISDEGMFVASDQLAFVGKAQSVVFLPEKSYACIGRDCYEIYDFDGRVLMVVPQPLSAVWSDAGKQGYEHFMLKEIHEQKDVVGNIVAALPGLQAVLEVHDGTPHEYIRDVEHIVLVGCGTSWHAAHIAKFFIESLCKIPVTVGLSSEYKHYQFCLPAKTVCIALSQSGETADTLEVVRLLKESALPIIALTNVWSSTLARESSCVIRMHAGQEVAVASTKAFSAQIASLFMFTHLVASYQGTSRPPEISFAKEELLVAAKVLEQSIELYAPLIDNVVAPWCATYKKAIFLGRHVSYVLAQEAALKLKEIAYIFSQAYPSGELKHGPIALIDDTVLLFIFSVLDPVVYQKLVSNAQEEHL